MPYGDRRALRRLLRREGHVPLHASARAAAPATPRSRRSPTTRCSSCCRRSSGSAAAAPATTCRRAARVPARRSARTRRTPRAPWRACARPSRGSPRCVEPTLGRDVRPDAHLAPREDQRDPRARRVRVDCRLPPGLGSDVARAPRRRSCSATPTGVEVEFAEAVVGNRSPIAGAADGRDRARGSARSTRRARRCRSCCPRSPTRAGSARRSRTASPTGSSPSATRTLYDDLAADALRRRAHRRARPRLRRASSSPTCRGGFADRDDRPTRRSSGWAGWRCATACSCTGRRTGRPPCARAAATIKAASGRKPRLRAADPVPACAASRGSRRRSP